LRSIHEHSAPVDAGAEYKKQVQIFEGEVLLSHLVKK
jgi:hypothetical protein